MGVVFVCRLCGAPGLKESTLRTRPPRLAAPILIGLVTAACGASGVASDTGGSGGGGGRLRVVATTTQVADFVRNVGGGKVTVTQILKPNVDPHDYEPSPADMQAIAEADVVVENGVGLERWLDTTIESAGFDGTLVDASKGVPIRRGDGTAGDPHIWHSPKNAEIMSRNIAAAFDARDAADRATYDANLAAYSTRLDRLDAWITRQIGTLPVDRRKLVTNHDAFGYYVDRYHLTFVGSIIPSFDTSAELSGRQLNTLAARIRSTGVKAIFSESSLPPKTAEAIGRQTGVRIEAGEDSLYGDTLGPAGSAGATYLDMERHNTTVIVTALKG
jgi:ABC-type Zn uptake system ZnuABC Zn-binding protein ZnuA